MNRSGGRWRWIRVAAGYAFALAGLVWVFHDLAWHEVAAALAGLRWGWVPLAIACDIASYFAQGCRWSLLVNRVGSLSGAAEIGGDSPLRATRSLSPIRATQAVYAGLFVNELFPLRLGEVLRGYLVSRWLGVEARRVIPSMVVERFLDSLWVALAVATVAVFVPLPRDLARAADVLGILVALAAAFFLVLIWRQKRSIGRGGPPSPPPETPLRRSLYKLEGILRQQADGVSEIGLSSHFFGAALLTALLLVLQGIAFWLVLLACQVHVAVWAGLAVFLLVHFGTAIPNAPGNMGSYQFFCVLGLALFGVDKAQAAAFSLVVFVLLTAPLWGLGFLALQRTGIRLGGLRQEMDS